MTWLDRCSKCGREYLLVVTDGENRFIECGGCGAAEQIPEQEQEHERDQQTVTA